MLVVDGEGYAFRHALIREALRDEALPGELTRLHARYAEALEADPTLLPPGRRAVELAHQWYAARDNARALSAAWTAADETRAVSAYTEQLRMLERVLDLWDVVPDAAARTGTDHVGVLELAVRAADSSGEPERGVALASAALREVDRDTEPVRASLLLERRGRMHGVIKGDVWMDDLWEALRLVPANRPSGERAWILASIGQALVLEGASEDALPLVEEAHALARRVGDRYTETHALISLGLVRTVAGDWDAAQTTFVEGEALANHLGEPALAVRALVNQAYVLGVSGEQERAVEVGRRGLAQARSSGLMRTSGGILTGNLAAPLIALGRWDEASEILERALETDPPLLSRVDRQTQQGMIALYRGDRAFAAAVVESAHAAFGRDYLWTVSEQGDCLELEIRLRRAEGRPAEALDVLDRALAADAPNSLDKDWPVVLAGAGACADLADDLEESTRHRARRLLERLRERAGMLHHSRSRDQRAYRQAFLAELARADAASGPSAELASWDAAVAAWGETQQLHPRAEALLRGAEAAASAGDREGAAERLRRCVRITDHLGAVPLRDEAHDLARRARLALGDVSEGSRRDRVDASPSAGSPADRFGLTEREREVLRLVADGRSNRGVAEDLFISVKTASVHVSNILAKLGVASRGEAAATAHRLQLLDGASDTA